MVIWKYSLDEHFQEVEIPLAGKVIHVGQQGGAPTIWAIVDPEQQSHVRRFYVVATGGVVPTPAVYHGTVQMPSGLVWHIFEGGHA
jgi:hypothetical protein